MNLRLKVTSGLRWTAAAKLIGHALTWVISVVVMRLLSPADYGLMAMATSLLPFFAIVNNLGFGDVLIQKRDLEEVALRQIMGLLQLTSLGLFLLALCISPLVSSFFNESRVIPIIALLSTKFLLTPFEVVPSSLIIRDMNFKIISLVDFFSAVTGSLTTLALALNGYGVWALAWGSLAMNISRAVALNIVCSYPHKPSLSFEGMKSIISFGGKIVACRIISLFYNNADVFIIGRLMGKRLLGAYSAAMNLALLPMHNIAAIINQVALPAFAHIQNDAQKIGSNFLKAVHISSFLVFPALWGISCISAEIVPLLFGEKWMLAVLPLQILTLVIPVRMVSSIISSTLLGFGRPDVILRNELTIAVVIPAGVLVGSFWGIVGASLAWTTLFPIVFLINLQRLSATLQIRITMSLKAMASPIIAASVMYISVHFFKSMIISPDAQVLHLAILILIGVTSYLFIMLILDRGTFREFFDLVRN